MLPGLFESYHSPPLTLSSQVVYTERFESKGDLDSSSINLVRCSRFKIMDTSQTMSDDQVPYITSCTSQRNPNYKEVEKVWLSDDPSRSMSITLPDASETQGGGRTLLPYSTSSLLPSIHTIILDFSMVHLVDAQALVVLRQVSTKEAFTRTLIPSYHHHPRPDPDWILLVTG